MPVVLPDSLIELIRSQVPAAGTDVESHPLVVFLQELVEEVNALEDEVAAL
jgi:hypothetical protein